jgi:hypothetical protein
LAAWLSRLRYLSWLASGCAGMNPTPGRKCEEKMNTLNPVVVILIGSFLRLIVPVLLTALLVYLLGKLDAHWQEEARKEEKLHEVNAMPCIKEEGLTPEQVKLHMALSDQPCWQAHRARNGYLNAACLECEVFLSAPASPARVHVHI